MSPVGPDRHPPARREGCARAARRAAHPDDRARLLFQRLDRDPLAHLDAWHTAGVAQQEVIEDEPAHAQQRRVPTRVGMGAALVSVPKARATRVIGGAPVASTSPRTPRRSRLRSASDQRRCVERVSLGKVAASSSRTRQPRAASPSAVAAPATRAPTMIAS